MWKRRRGGQSFPIHFYYKTGAKHASLPHCGPALWGAWLMASSQHVVSVNSNGIPYMRFRDNDWNNMKCNVNVLGVTSPPLLTAWGPKPEQSLHLCLNKPPPPSSSQWSVSERYHCTCMRCHKVGYQATTSLWCTKGGGSVHLAVL